MPRSRSEDDEEFDEAGFGGDLLDEDGELDDFDDEDLVDDLDDEKLEDLAKRVKDDDDDEEEDDDEDDEDGLDINKETEDWSESLDDMESDYWEDYTRGPQ